MNAARLLTIAALIAIVAACGDDGVNVPPGVGYDRDDAGATTDVVDAAEKPEQCGPAVCSCRIVHDPDGFARTFECFDDSCQPCEAWCEGDPLIVSNPSPDAVTHWSCNTTDAVGPIVCGERQTFWDCAYP